MLLEVTRRYRAAISPRFEILCRKPEGMPEIENAQFTTLGAAFFDPPQSRLMRSAFYRLPFLADLWCVSRGLLLLAHAHCFRVFRRKLGRMKGADGLVERLAASDLVHCYGGGFLADGGENAVGRPFCFILLAARLLHRRVVITGQGVGPLSSSFDRWLVRKAFAGADVCAVREAGAYNSLLEKMCRDIPTIQRDGDDAVGFPSAPVTDDLDRSLHEDGIPRRPVIAVQCRINEYTGGGDLEQGFVRLIDAVIETLGVHVLFVPMLDTDDCDDVSVAARIRSQLKGAASTTVIHKGYSGPAIRTIISRCDAALGLSYHFLLFALASGVGSVGLYQTEYYRLKLLGLFAHFDETGSVVPMDESAQLRVVERLREILSETGSERQRRVACGRRMDERVTRTFHDVLSLLPAYIQASEDDSAAPLCTLA